MDVQVIYIVAQLNDGNSILCHVASDISKAINWIKENAEFFILDETDTFSITRCGIDDIDMTELTLIDIYDEKGEPI